MPSALRRATLLLWAGFLPILGGCSALKPLNGIPANYFPDELQGELRSGKRTIDLSLLRQTPPDAYRLDSGDVLSVYIDGVLGRRDQVPPVYVPREIDDTPPSFGYPVAVRDDGSIRLPLGRPLLVRGMTVPEAEEAIRNLVQTQEQLQNQGNALCLVSLQRSRHYNVTVIRQEQTTMPTTTGGNGQLQLGNVKRGTGKVVRLPAYKNDVLNALAETGGLPGLDAENTIYVIRRRAPRGPGPLPPGMPGPGLPPGVGKREGRAAQARRASTDETVIRGQSPDQEWSYSAGEGWSYTPAQDVPEETQSDAERYADQFGGAVHADGNSTGNLPPVHADLQRPAWQGHTPASTAQYAPAPPPEGAASPLSPPAGPLTPPGHLPLPTGAPPGYRPPPTPAPGYSPSVTPGYSPAVAPPGLAPAGPPVAPPTFPPAGGAPWPMFDGGEMPDAQGWLAQRRLDSEIITIPVRLGPGEAPQITEEDIILGNGDIVFIESRETEVFYTGGLLGGNQFALPRDYDIDVVRAIALASGQSSSSGVGWGSRLGGVSALNRDITVGASDVIVLRQLPNGSQVPIKVDLNKALRNPQKYSVRVLPGDYVILQYKPHEAVGAFIERNLLAGGLIGVAATNNRSR